MSEDNTHRTRQIARVEIFVSNYRMLYGHLGSLDCDLLSEDAIDNLKSMFAQAENWVEELERSTRKLLD